MKLFEGGKEKKVEYTELIYDLIFVYMIGRVNGLLQNIQGGFVAGASFLAYILCLLALIQIWNFSTYYVNMYGTNGVREHVFLFLNMFLLYFIGTSTKVHWQATQTRYHVAWALILLNIAVQYFIELNNHKCSPQEKKSILTVSIILVIESVIVLLGAFIHDTPGIYLSAAAVLFGIVATHFTGGGSYTNVDFMHLTERAMLFVVFTFGEMVVAIAGYFEGPVTLHNLYFAFMTFLVVVGLFLSYETLYDHIIDREQETNGLSYMFMHVFMIFGLNNVSSALEFMHEEEVRIWPKMIFLVASLLIYYSFLFGTGKYAKPVCRKDKAIRVPMISLPVAFVIFAVLMFVFRNNMAVNILVSVLFVYLVFGVLHHFAKKVDG